MAMNDPLLNVLAALTGAGRPQAPPSRRPQQPQPFAPAPMEPIDVGGFDLRPDGTAKSAGFLGGLLRPDGGVSSELSIGVELDGREVTIPTMVPTLTREEIAFLLSMPEGTRIPDAIADKAVEFARRRRASGRPYFAAPGEQQHGRHPDFLQADKALGVRR